MTTRIIELSDKSGFRVLWSRDVPYAVNKNDRSRNPNVAGHGRLNVETIHDFRTHKDAMEFARDVRDGLYDLEESDVGTLGTAAAGYPRLQSSTLQINR